MGQLLEAEGLEGEVGFPSLEEGKGINKGLRPSRPKNKTSRVMSQGDNESTWWQKENFEQNQGIKSQRGVVDLPPGEPIMEWSSEPVSERAG